MATKRTQQASVAAPSGANAPTTAPTQVDPAVQAAMEQVEPAPGFALTRLVLAAERHERLGLPEATEAMLDAAMLRVLAVRGGDDVFARDYPVGTIVFASLDGLAPLLGTYCFLVPFERIQGRLPGAGTHDGEPVGFR